MLLDHVESLYVLFQATVATSGKEQDCTITLETTSPTFLCPSETTSEIPYQGSFSNNSLGTHVCTRIYE